MTIFYRTGSVQVEVVMTGQSSKPEEEPSKLKLFFSLLYTIGLIVLCCGGWMAFVDWMNPCLPSHYDEAKCKIQREAGVDTTPSF